MEIIKADIEPNHDDRINTISDVMKIWKSYDSKDEITFCLTFFKRESDEVYIHVKISDLFRVLGKILEGERK